MALNNIGFTWSSKEVKDSSYSNDMPTEWGVLENNTGDVDDILNQTTPNELNDMDYMNLMLDVISVLSGESVKTNRENIEDVDLLEGIEIQFSPWNNEGHIVSNDFNV